MDTSRPLTPEQQQAQHDFAAVAGLAFGPPPRVERCPACKGEGEGCSEECRGTGRVVSGGMLPSLLSAASQLRAIVAAEMEMAPKNRKLWPELLDELCLLAESADRWSGLHARLQTERAETEQHTRELTAAHAQLQVDLAALHDHTQQLSAENEELRSEVGALQVEAEASRVAVQEALQVSAAALRSAS